MDYQTNTYYLETNSIRVLASKLVSQPYLDNCFTSILSICELLSGITDETSFNQRKGIVRKVYFSKIPADLDLPETKIFKAFGVPYETKLSDKIILLGALCIAAKSYQEYLSVIQKSQLLEYWHFLKKYDENCDSKFKESFKSRQENFDYSDPNMIPDFRNKWDSLNSNKKLRLNILSDLIVYFAETFLKPGSALVAKDKSLKDLVSFYDHSLDIYFMCIGYFSGTKIVFKNAPSRNDYFDLCHLMYLKNNSNIIVSNDRLLIDLMNKCNPHNILSVNDFQRKIE